MRWRLALLFLVLAVPSATPAASAATGPTTYRDFTYDKAIAPAPPTADKPQSKLWYQDGAWWGLLLSPADRLVHVFELLPDHTWRDTGTVVDNRPTATGDALWSGGKLYVVLRTMGGDLRYTRLSYLPFSRSYSADMGFPVKLAGGGFESATIARDTTGMLWTTFTQANKVWVMHSTTADTSWTAPFSPPVPDTAVSPDDISAVISFKGQIGVMWSNQVSAAFRFVAHQDGAPDSQWGPLETPLSGPDLADDHINLKNIEADADGRLYAAVKTSQGDAGEPQSSPLDLLLVRSGAGVWASYTFSTVAEDETRPLVLLDQTNHMVYFFATAPTTPGGTVYYKSAPMGNIAFGPGKGTPFVTWPGAVINNPTSAKQPVTSTTGIVVLASDATTGTYYHAEMPLPGTTAPAVTLVQPPDGSFTNDTTPTLSGAAGPQPGDASTVTAKIFAGTAASGSPVQTLTAAVSSGAWSVDASALAEGTYTARAYQSNADGLVGTSAAHTFTVDTTAPETSIDSAPPDPSTSSSVSFSFSSTEPGSGFACRLDGGTWSACSSPTQLTGLSSAQHTFDVRATDRAGNTDATPATDSFTVSAPASASFRPVADTFSRQDKPDTNSGTLGYMRIVTATGVTKRAYLRFDVTGLSGTVTSATLQLWTESPFTVSGIDLNGVTDNTWGETTLTWNDAPVVGAAVARGGANAPSGTWITIDATPVVSGNGTVSMALTTTSGNERYVGAREDATHAPKLVVETQ